MKKTYVAVIASLSLIMSCSDETTVFQETLTDDVLLETSSTALENSINYEKAGVLEIYENNTSASKTSKISDDELAGDYPLTLVAQVDPPSRSGSENLTASHIQVVNDYAYVSYNTVEDGYSGAIDIVNVSDPTSPKVTSRLFYVNADVNAIQYSDGYVYIAGGVDSEQSVTATENSFLAKIMVSNGRLNISAGITYGFQEGYNATDVVISGDKVYVTSGGEGYLTVYNKNSLEVESDVAFDDLRSVAVKNNKIALLDASSGVKILDAGLNTTGEIAINSDFGINTKRTIAFSDENVIVAEGARGAGVYDVSAGSLIEYIPIMAIPGGVDTQDVVTNAVATNDNVILMANGGAGLCLSEKQGNGSDLIGIIALDASINYVATKGDYVFAAAGKDGLQIIKLNKPSLSLEASCSDVANYRGGRNLNVNSGDVLAYKGSKRFNSVNINGELLLCGTWTVSNATNLNANAKFSMNGTYVVGRNNKRKNITVNSGATFVVEGNLTIYGDLILNDGATIEFLGSSSVVNVFGNVRLASDAQVLGSFNDVKNKF